MRYLGRSRPDRNQAEIMRQLTTYGMTVVDTHDVGGGFGDIAVGYQGENFFFEIKNPKVRKCDRELTKDEKEFHKTWLGQIDVIQFSEDAVKIIYKKTGAVV